MGKYDPLGHYLESRAADSVDANFAQLEDILGFPLPPSAYRHQAWWANETHGSHSHSRSWQDAGFQTSDVNLSRRTVRFERQSGRGPAPDGSGPEVQATGGSDLESLFQKASAVTGEQDRAVLMANALQALIRHEAAQYLASLGGSDPNAKAPPRRRFS